MKVTSNIDIEIEVPDDMPPEIAAGILAMFAKNVTTTQRCFSAGLMSVFNGDSLCTQTAVAEAEKMEGPRVFAAACNVAFLILGAEMAATSISEPEDTTTP